MKITVADSPACPVADSSAMSTNLQLPLKAAGHKVSDTKPTFEVNPQPPLMRALKHEPDEKRFADWSHILLDQAVLAEAGQLETCDGWRLTGQEQPFGSSLQRPENSGSSHYAVAEMLQA